LNQVDLPVKVVVHGTLGFVELEMKASGFFVDVGCDLKNPNFADMAEAIGIKGIRVEKPTDLQGALMEAFGHSGPALLDVVSERQELIMPPKTTLTQARGFGLFLMRAVLDGRATQLIDLAKANLTR
jgi:pyruvate dehydrogenase (quinone)